MTTCAWIKKLKKKKKLKITEVNVDKIILVFYLADIPDSKR
jgi:hypothetical protein